MRATDSTGEDRGADALRFRVALTQLSTRAALALRVRIVQGLTRSECAAFLGVSQSAFDVLFLRAVRELRGRLESSADGGGRLGGSPSPATTRGSESYAEEVEQAEHLAASIDPGSKRPGHPLAASIADGSTPRGEHLTASTDPGSTLRGDLGALLVLVRRLQAIAPEIRAQDSAALREEETSPALRRRNLLRRALLLAIVGAGLLLYLRPRPLPRVISRVPQEELR